MNKIILLSLAIVLLLQSCSSSNNVLKKTLASNNKKIKNVMQNPKPYEIQIIYTQIKRNKKGTVSFKDYTYNLNEKNYFYPASMVKFPIAIMALEKLATIENTSINNQYLINGETEKCRFSDEISKIFAVSDNKASNNLFEFIGADYLNSKMTEKGLSPFRVTSRLAVGNKKSNDLATSSITLLKNDGSLITIPGYTSAPIIPLKINKTTKGIGCIKTDETFEMKPFDFTKSNYFPLQTMHNTLKRLIFPEAFSKKEQFKIRDTDREFTLNAMKTLPRNAGYDAKEYYDSFCKYFIYGDDKDAVIPNDIKIYNKVGQAYGTLTDCAYIIDTKNNIEFMLSATILVNKNQIFNDNVYEYDTIGFPFLAQLGREIYERLTKNLKME